VVSSFLPYPLWYTRFPATARPRRRGSLKHGGGIVREGEGPRLNLASPGSIRARAGVHGNAGVGLACVRAQARTRTRPARRGVAGSTGIGRRTRRHKKARLWKRRALTKAATPARSCIPTWQCGGAACRRGGRRGRRWRVVGEEEEVGEVGIPGDGGSGSSHGRLRSSRRTVLPRAAPLLLLPSFTPFSSVGSVWVVRRATPLGRLGLGAPLGLGGGFKWGCAARGHADG
jgi:hypothetical protein